MILKDISIKSEFMETQVAVTENRSLHPDSAKSDVFLIADFEDYIGKKVELMRNSDGKYYEGILESVKIDIEPLIKVDFKNVLYQIKLKGHDDVFEIFAERIDYNSNNLKKYYFLEDGNITWRIIFF